MAGIDRRYKLLKQGLAGDSGFSVGDLSDGEVLYFDGSKWQNTDAVKIDPDGAVELQYAGAKSLETDTNGAVLYDPRIGSNPVGRQPLLWLKWQDGSNAVLLGNNSDAESILRSYVPGANWLVEARNAADTALNKILTGEPDGSVDLYYDGAKHLMLDAGGVVVRRGSNTSPILSFNATDASRNAFIQAIDGSHLRIVNEVHGGQVRIQGEDAGGTLRSLLIADPDDSTALYYAGSVALETISGSIKFGTHSALAGETVTGYITVQDSAGNTRKLAVVS